MTLLAGTPIGKYVVHRKLAEGGMAEIFLCKATGAEGFEKEVVIKRVRPALAHDEQFVEMFIHEARLASRLNHPNVVQIYDFAKHEDTYYLAMEYVRGASLHDVRRRARELMMPMPVTLAAQLAMEVARGLHYAHKLTDRSGRSLQLVHRDVTPHNVLVSFEGAVKLTDFGIAKAGNRLSQAGSLKGKFAYMSPEQARGEEIDSRTDLFALGIVLWELLTGGRLFDADSDIALLKVVQTRAIAPPRRLNPDVPEALDKIVVKALERDPAQRYQTAQELERALWQFVATHATSPEQTDVAGYLHKLYSEADQGRGGGTGVFSQPGTGSGSGSNPAPPPREPTAVQRPGAASPAPAPRWDEDPNASTHVVARQQPQEAEQAAEKPREQPAPPPPASPARRGNPAIWVGAAIAVLALGGAALTLRKPEPVPEAPPAIAAQPQPARPPELQPEPPAPAPALAPVTTTVPASATAQPAAALPSDVRAQMDGPMEGDTGAVELTLVPWADVTLQGEFYKNVSFKRRFTLPVGKHALKLDHRGQVRRLTLEIKKGEVLRKVERFRR